MSTETNKAIVRRYFEEVLNEKRYDLVEEFLTENIELHGTGLTPGLEAVKQFLSMFTAAFPDVKYSIEDLVAEEDRVVARTLWNGTHQADMKGIPATGKTVSLTTISIFRLKNGKIAEGWNASDDLGLMQQLGVIPMPQES